MHFNPEQSLFELEIVKRTAIVTVVVSIILCIIIALHASEPIALDGESFNHAANIFKVPLAVLAVGFTLVGIFGANHRSEQTKRQLQRSAHQIELAKHQIEVNRGQNNFSNFYKHLEEFQRHAEKLPDGISESRKLHRKLFEGARLGNYRVTDAAAREYELFIEEFYRHAAKLKTDDSEEAKQIIIIIARHLHSFMRSFYLLNTYITDLSITLEDAEGRVLFPRGNARGLIDSIFRACQLVNRLMEFDSDYLAPASFEKLKTLQIERMPPQTLAQWCSLDLSVYFSTQPNEST